MEFMKKFKPNEFCLKEFKHWIIVLRQKQLTLGASVILLKREVSNVGEVFDYEFAEFPEVISWYEEKCKALFQPDKFNYVAAMMKDNFVHFHAFPRYSSDKQLNNTVWQDTYWPRPIVLDNCQTDGSILLDLLNLMKE